MFSIEDMIIFWKFKQYVYSLFCMEQRWNSSQFDKKTAYKLKLEYSSIMMHHYIGASESLSMHQSHFRCTRVTLGASESLTGEIFSYLFAP